ncbi:MAG: GNAT family N-acetyltransferase [Reichenbachiella sp.]
MTTNNSIQVREMMSDDIESFVNYWLSMSPEFLEEMGVDIKKRPTRAQLENLINDQIGVDMKKRKSYFLTWLINDIPVGCSNVNQIEYGQKAFMHLHLWNSENRQKGMGREFIKKSLPYYFDNLELQTLYCEPYSLNPAPNKTVEKLGFEFVKQHTTIPGASNFEQVVNQWKLTKSKYIKIITP